MAAFIARKRAWPGHGGRPSSVTPARMEKYRDLQHPKRTFAARQAEKVTCWPATPPRPSAAPTFRLVELASALEIQANLLWTRPRKMMVSGASGTPSLPKDLDGKPDNCVESGTTTSSTWPIPHARAGHRLHPPEIPGPAIRPLCAPTWAKRCVARHQRPLPARGQAQQWLPRTPIKHVLLLWWIEQGTGSTPPQQSKRRFPPAADCYSLDGLRPLPKAGRNLGSTQAKRGPEKLPIAKAETTNQADLRRFLWWVRPISVNSWGCRDFRRPAVTPWANYAEIFERKTWAVPSALKLGSLPEKTGQWTDGA